MFVVSVSKSKIKKSLYIALSVIILSVIFIVLLKGFGFVQSTQTNQGISLIARNEEEHLKYISHYGWEVDEEPVEVREVVIPEIFDDVYNNYNEIQLKQGFDLKNYAGQKVKRWTYIIRNYPGTVPEDNYIRLNLLINDGVIIGGDVCSVKLDGFMHGFYKE